MTTFTIVHIGQVKNQGKASNCRVEKVQAEKSSDVMLAFRGPRMSADEVKAWSKASK